MTSRGPGRTPGPCIRRACSPTTSSTGSWPALDELDAPRHARRADAPGQSDEDVHGALEGALVDLVGPELGGKLRAGRSRNDQIATLFKVFLRDHARIVAALGLDLADALPTRPSGHLGAMMPGRTHLQHAQPVLLSHHLMAHAWPLVRDVGRIRDWDPGRGRLAVRLRRAGRLQPRPGPGGGGRATWFTGSTANSIDGTASRDFVAELAFVPRWSAST